MPSGTIGANWQIIQEALGCLMPGWVEEQAGASRPLPPQSSTSHGTGSQRGGGGGISAGIVGSFHWNMTLRRVGFTPSFFPNIPATWTLIGA